MTQQINLFTPLFMKQRKYFSTATMLQAFALLFGAMAVFYAYEYVQQGALERQLAETEGAFKLQTQQLAAATAALPQAQTEAGLDQQIKDTQAGMESAQNLLGHLPAADGTRTGYSEYLRAFSRQAVEGLWLTGVHIGDTNDDLSVTGRAAQADLVPELVRRLNREDVLRGRPLESLGMRRVVPEAPKSAGEAGAGAGGASAAAPVRVMPPYLEFTLASKFRDFDTNSAAQSAGPAEGSAQAPAPQAGAAVPGPGAAPAAQAPPSQAR